MLTRTMKQLHELIENWGFPLVVFEDNLGHDLVIVWNGNLTLHLIERFDNVIINNWQEMDVITFAELPDFETALLRARQWQADILSENKEV